MKLDWSTLVTAAKTAEEVLQVSRSFLASLPPAFISELPAPCRPPLMGFAQDVSSYAFTLANACIVRDAVEDELLEMTRFFGAASQRLAVILTPRGFILRPRGPSPPNA